MGSGVDVNFWTFVDWVWCPKIEQVWTSGEWLKVLVVSRKCNNWLSPKARKNTCERKCCNQMKFIRNFVSKKI